jgi:hypothetical protein
VSLKKWTNDKGEAKVSLFSFSRGGYMHKSPFDIFKKKRTATIGDRLLSAYETAISKMPKQRQKTIRDLVAKEFILRSPIDRSTPVWTGKGTELFFDSLTNTRFYSTFNNVENAFKKINLRLKNGAHNIPLSDFFEDLNVRVTDQMRNLVFNSEVKYEIKVVEEGPVVDNVIFFVTRPVSRG